MPRWLGNILAFFSLLLVLAISAQYIHSYWALRGIRYVYPADGKYFAIGAFSSPGYFGLFHVDTSVSSGTIRRGWETYRYTEGPINFMVQQGGWYYWGFGFARNPKGCDICFPYWFPILLLLPYPILRLRRWRLDRKRSHTGLCQSCGYDLRASQDRCPECGTPIPADFIRKPIQ